MKEKLSELQKLLGKLSQKQLVLVLSEIKKEGADKKASGNISFISNDRASRSLKDL